MKRLIYLVVGALVSAAVLAPPAAGQGEDLQQALQQAQEKVQQAQDYMQSPEGQQALQEARDNLQQARDNVQQAGQQFQKAREGAQEEMQEVTTKSERTTEGLPQSGGAPLGSVLLPVTALLVGSGLLAYAVLSRRR